MGSKLPAHASEEEYDISEAIIASEYLQITDGSVIGKSPNGSSDGDINGPQPTNAVHVRKYAGIPEYARVQIEALKKNRLLQKNLRLKLVQVETKMDENKELRNRVKCLVDFQSACKRHLRQLFMQDSNYTVELISRSKSRLSSKKLKETADNKVGYRCRGPPETENDVRGGEHYGLHCLEVCRKEGEDQLSFEVSLKDGFMKTLELHRSRWVSLGISEDSMYRTILKEALLRAVFDIDIAFTNEALISDLQSGSTASIVLKANEYVLVANIGDSKAFLCTECSNLPEQLRGASWREHKRKRYKTTQLFRQENSNNPQSLLCVKELTRDHRPDRDEERTRIEAAGGSVLKWGDVPRVNGELAISRAIGDVSFKK